MWTPFCSKKPKYQHDLHCKEEAACPYCGAANPSLEPKEPPPPLADDDDDLILLDSPPAHMTMSRFSGLDPTVSNASRRDAIRRTQKQQLEIPHAGSLAHSVRPKNPAGKNDRLAAVKKYFSLTVFIYTGRLNDPKLRTYENWKSLREYTSI